MGTLTTWVGAAKRGDNKVSALGRRTVPELEAEVAKLRREACRGFLEGQLRLTLNMEKTHVTHVNDGFVFLGHRIIRKRCPRGRMRVVSTIPWEKCKHRPNTVLTYLPN